jgi:PAT family beta-lactamase induction signal transducer AmpG
VSAIDAAWGTGSMLVGGLVGGWFVGKRGLRATLPILGLCLNIPHLTYVVLSQVGAAGHGAAYPLVVSMVVIEKFGYGFGFVGNMIYMMQQLAPGRATMTHYAFATALMNLTLVPTNMISGPLADWLGFSTYFVVVMFASVPSAWSAFKAPFPRDEDPEHPATEDVTITADDHTQLTPAQLRVQSMAGRASIYAMLTLLTLLIADANILGTLQGKHGGAAKWQFWALIASALLKTFFAIKALGGAAEATAVAATTGEKIYVRNARGARITTYLCALASVAVLAFGAHVAL